MEIDQEQQPTSFVQSRYLCTTAQGVRTSMQFALHTSKNIYYSS